MGFTHHFEERHPEGALVIRGEIPPIEGGISMAITHMDVLASVKSLPERNRAMLHDMSRVMMEAANHTVGSRVAEDPQYWGLYIVGSRAVGSERPDSDLDLLSVGTFYDRLRLIRYGPVNMM